MRILDHARETRGDRETRVDIVDINGEMLKEGHMSFKKTVYHNSALRASLRGVVFSPVPGFLALMMGPYSVAGRFC